MNPKFTNGEEVQLLSTRPSKLGIIWSDPKFQAETYTYQVFFNADDCDTWYPESALQSAPRHKSFTDAFAAEDFLDLPQFLKFLILEKIHRPLANNLYAFHSSRTEFLVYQFKPALKFIRSPTQRLFIADEVGLGKTIETGIILTELEARLQGLSRVLVVCPSAISEKWKNELQNRFDQHFEILDRERFNDFLDRFKDYGESEKLRAICTLEMLRRADLIGRLADLNVHFDLVIIDESHHLKTSGSRGNELGEVLAENADAMVMLSATPLHLGTKDLFNQLRILCPNDFPEFEFFRDLIEPNQYINAAIRQLRNPKKAASTLRLVENTRHRKRFTNNPNYRESVRVLESHQTIDNSTAIDVQHKLTELNTLSYLFTRTKRADIQQDVKFPRREAKVIDVYFSPEEMEVYDSVTNWATERYRDSASGVGFARVMPQRQVSSCIPAMKEYLHKLLKEGLVDGPGSGDGDMIGLENSDANDFLDARERASVQRLLTAVNRIGKSDTKCDRFIEALCALREEQPKAKILVFSFFKRTLNYLSRRLTEKQFVSAVIHGDIKPKERMRRIRRFWNDENLPILLTSEVGGEGLDFQIANVIFNYDLPWNPMRVEQRIGRLDRFGQKHEKILIYNFSMKGTIDDIILSRLYSRIDIFEKYIGDLEAILGDQINTLTREMMSPQITAAERISKAEKIAENLVRRKKDLSHFEKQSEGFIGQDEFFTQEITNIRDRRRFVSPEELRFLLETFFTENNSSSTLKSPKSGTPGVFVLKTDDEFRALVAHHAPDDPTKNDLLRRLDHESGTLVTFESQEAIANQDLHFITIQSPIIKAISAFQKATCALPLGRLRIPRYEGLSGVFFLFLYLIEMAGVKTSFQVVPILVKSKDPQTFFIDDKLAEKLVGDLMQAEEAADSIAFSSGDVRSAENMADELIAMLRNEKNDRLERDNEVMVNNQIESIRQSHNLKRSRIQNKIRSLEQKIMVKPEDAGPQRILRLNKGQLRNLKLKSDESEMEWEAKRAVSVGYSRMAAAVIDFS